MTNQHIITDTDEGIRLDRWFKRHHPGFPHGMLEKSLRKGLIRLDGKKAKSSDRIQKGQVITMPDIKLAPAEKPKKRYIPTPEEVEMMRESVLFENKDMIAINKPAGLAVQGGSKVKKSVDDLLGALAEEGRRPKLTHRLDRDTSGVLLLARDAKSATYLTQQFAEKTIEKTYLALVQSTPHPLEGTIENKLSKLEGFEKEYVVQSEDGKHAVTHYRVLESLAGKFALVELRPETGRTHQLRVHMQAKGCPIVGDHKYGADFDTGKAIGMEDLLHLHAWKIQLKQPNGEMLEIIAPLPPHMKNSFASLEIEVPDV